MTHASDSGLDPTGVSTVERFVDLLRRLRAQSGLTYRTIARRAESNGDVLPASTLATMLGRRTLPRRDLVVALLRACDVPADRRAAWLAAWNALATTRSTTTVAAPAGRRPYPAVIHPGPRGAASRPDSGTVAVTVAMAMAGRHGSGDAVPAGGRGTGPAPPAGTAAPFQLPPPPPIMIGRDAEAARLLAALTADRAVCIVDGPGGIGKSALALHVAHQIARRHPGAYCLYAELHGASAGLAPAPPIDLLARFLRALDIRTVPSSVEEASALFRTLTARQRVLVVLDDAASAAQVRPLLPAGPECVTLVTSRWRLPDLDVTARLTLGPVSAPAAVDLLGRLCGPARLAAEPAAVSTIVSRCGGLPLALRIVGARAATRPEATLAGLAERLDDERRYLDELQVGDLSVRAGLRVGYREFSAAPEGGRRTAARLFRLAALPDWADAGPAACAALAGLPVRAAEQALDQLVEAHLLEPSGDGRYRFHDTVRIFAREQADAAESPAERTAALRRLTASLFATAAVAARLLYPHDRFTGAGPSSPGNAPRPADAPRSDGPPLAADAPLSGGADAWAWLAREHTNLLLVARQQLAVGECLPIVRDLAPTVAKFLDYTGRFAELAEFGRLAVQAAQRLDDRPGLARALNSLAVAALQQGRPAEGIDLLERSLAVLRELGDRTGEAMCLNNLGNAHRDSGDLDAALRHLLASLAIRWELDDRYKVGSTLDNLGIVHRRRGDYDRALAHHRAGLAITRRLGDRHRESLMLTNLAETLHAAGDYGAAAARAREALALCEELDHRRGCGLALRVLADACAAQGLPDRAREHRERALALLDGVDEEACAALRAALAEP
ncbi:tetratricopeptide repeat protein [Planosporangium sp. 12N6]|uniref:tetratricopeptide repeat protein n=1 Tax=Planosporangium spinosum TaxID=3402278 RepID=UPI003CEA322B